MSNRAWAELFLLSAIWGGTFYSVAIALREIGPLTAVLYRVALGAAFLWTVAAVWRMRLPRDPRFWAACLVMGLLNNAIPFSLLTFAQTQVESGLVAILNATTAFFGALAAAAFLKAERLTVRRVTGVSFGIAGVAAIMGWEALGALDLRSVAQLACLGAAISYAFASVWARVLLTRESPVISAAGMLTGSTLILAPFAIAMEGTPRLTLTAETWAAVLYYALVATGLAFLLYYRILRTAGPANLLLCTILVMPIGILMGWAFLGERLPPSALLGFCLITAGLVVLDGRALARLRRGLAGR